MAKTSRKNISKKNTSRKNKKSKKNVKNYSRKNKINKMRGGEGLDGLKLNKIRKNDKSLTVLDFTDTEINDDQVKLLADALRTNTVVTSITFNKISYEGAKALIIVLFGNTTLTEFKINDSENIKELKESDPEIMFDFEFITKLNKIRKNDKSLTVLDFTDTEINDDQVKLLADALRTNTVVTSITFNKISYEGAKALIIVLFGNTTLTEFKINDSENIKELKKSDPEIMFDFEIITKRNIYREIYKKNNQQSTLAEFTKQFYAHLKTVDSEFYNENQVLIDTLENDNFGLRLSK
jgi:hypothetical protein